MRYRPTFRTKGVQEGLSLLDGNERRSYLAPLLTLSPISRGCVFGL
jgi:hypothetical protein